MIYDIMFTSQEKTYTMEYKFWQLLKLLLVYQHKNKYWELTEYLECIYFDYCYFATFDKTSENCMFNFSVRTSPDL